MQKCGAQRRTFPFGRAAASNDAPFPHRYRLISRQGEGTFSEVFKAQSVKTGRYTAIKCMKNKFDSIEQVCPRVALSGGPSARCCCCCSLSRRGAGRWR